MPRKAFGYFLADAPLAIQNIGDAALRSAIVQIFLCQPMLLHGIRKRKTSRGSEFFREVTELFVLISLHLIGKIIQNLGQRMVFVIADFVKQCIDGFARTRVVFAGTHRRHANQSLERQPCLKQLLWFKNIVDCLSHHVLRFHSPLS